MTKFCHGQQRFWEIAEATIEDLAFGIRSSREPGRVGRRVCIEPVWNEGNGKKETLSSENEQRQPCELRSRREERMENGVKNLIGS